MKNRIGLLGGTFNPVHKGHIELGSKILDAFKLNKVLYILSANPPHKKESNIAPAEIRWEMLCKILEPFPDLLPCDIEMKRNKFSWTFDTIKILKQDHPGDIFFFISGSEAFLKIKTWKNYKSLLKSTSFIVVLREEKHSSIIQNLLNKNNIQICFDVNNQIDSPCVYIYSYDSDKLFISSSLIREKLKSYESIDDLVQKEVKKIMEEYNLYEN